MLSFELKVWNDVWNLYCNHPPLTYYQRIEEVWLFRPPDGVRGKVWSLCKRGTVEVAGFLKSHFRFFAILHTCVAISQNNATPLNIIFELGADFGHLLFEPYLVIEWTDSNRTKWITWPMSGHNFHVLWTNPVKCAHRPWCHQMYRIFIRGDRSHMAVNHELPFNINLYFMA